MLLKDCPVGSVVRCVKWAGGEELPYYVPAEITVESDVEKYFFDTSGMKWQECDCLKDDFEIIHHAPKSAPEPRITFTVGGQEFYVGQRVWSLTTTQVLGTPLRKGDELKIIAHIPCYDTILCSKSGDASGFFFDITQLSTTPPAPHEWKRGDWARHEDRGVVFVAGKSREWEERIFVVDKDSQGYHCPRSELTFIFHSEPPK